MSLKHGVYEGVCTNDDWWYSFNKFDGSSFYDMTNKTTLSQFMRLADTTPFTIDTDRGISEVRFILPMEFLIPR